MAEHKHFYVYLLQCADFSYYCGWTIDLDRRLQQHNLGIASRYTRARLPAILVYAEQCASKSESLKREFAIKQLSRLEKEALVDRFAVEELASHHKKKVRMN